MRAQPALYLGRVEAEPEISLAFSERLVVVLVQIDDEEFATVLERPVGFGDGAGGIRQVMQDHASHHSVYLAVGRWQMSQIP